MLQLRAFGSAQTITEVAARLAALPGSRHVLRTEDESSGNAVVTADFGAGSADRALAAVRRLGVPGEDVQPAAGV